MLAKGTKIGAYEVQSPLGRGGMGEVFLARDTRLDRQVAIKALPAHLAQDADRLARFQREAKVLASLNHPGIGAIHGLEEANGNQYLILEFIEGETLADRLSKGPIPVDEALAFAKQIAEALEVAHEKGIVHRDLKPGNVMVTPDGAVKVLDFGLARTEDGAPASSVGPARPDSPTVTSPARLHSPTIPGVIMGTAGYMSPEQARGKPVDKRSDIFSFGCVLFEMLTGAQPFRGETVADAIGATLHKESDLNLLPARTPRRVRDLLTSCLAKDRKNRLHDIGDARLELERAITEPAASKEIGQEARPWWKSPRGFTAISLASVAVISLAFASAAIVAMQSKSEREHRESAKKQLSGQVVRATLVFPKGLTLLESDRAVAVSPDGTQVVVSLIAKDGSAPASLFVRDLSRLEFRPLAGTEEATYPCWSPDGKSIAFFGGRKLRRLDLADGIVRTLCDAPTGRGASWGTKGTIVFAPSAGGGLSIVSDSGGAPTPITTVNAPGESHRMPQMLPDGERFLHIIQESGVYAFDPATKQSRLVLAGPAEAMFVEPGYLVFARDENLMVQPFDVQRLELTGSARPIAANVQYDKARAFNSAGISARGALVYQLVNPAARFRLAWMDRKGERTPLPVEPIAMRTLAASLSQDGRRAVFELAGNRAESSIAVVDLERGIKTPLGDPAVDLTYGGLWAPGEQSVLGSQARQRKQSLVQFPIGGGAGTAILEGESGFEYGATSITPDGKTLLLTQTPLRDKTGDIMTLGLEKDQLPKRFMATPEPEWAPRISPTGDIVAYAVSKEEDVSSVLKVVAYPTPSAPVQVSATPSTQTFGWLSAGELCWVDTARRMWSATITSKDGRIDVSVPKAMFDGRLLDKQIAILEFDLARERFLVAIEDEPRDDPRLIIVSDWRTESIAEKPDRN